MGKSLALYLSLRFNRCQATPCLLSPHFPTSVPCIYLTSISPSLSVDGSEASQAAPSWGGEPTSGGWLRSKYYPGNTPTPVHTHHCYRTAGGQLEVGGREKQRMRKRREKWIGLFNWGCAAFEVSCSEGEIYRKLFGNTGVIWGEGCGEQSFADNKKQEHKHL